MKNRRKWFYLVICIFLLNNCSGITTTESTIEKTGGEMSTLGIYLLDGFDQDTVVLKINDEEVFYKTDVSYKLLIGGTGESFETKIKNGIINIEIIIETKRLQGNKIQDITKDTKIGVSIIGDEIMFIELPNDFGLG